MHARGSGLRVDSLVGGDARRGRRFRVVREGFRRRSNSRVHTRNSGRYDDPKLAVLLRDRCVEWNKKQESDKAIEDCSQAIRLKPDDARAFSNRGGAYIFKDQYDRAIEDFDQAIRLNPNYALAFYNRALSWERKSDLQRALADLKKFAELAPSDSDGPTAVERVTKALNGR